MADTLSIISVISFIAAGLFFVIAVIMWFLFKIPSVIGDLSGRNARISIEQMRKNNEKNGNKSYKSSTVNVAGEKFTEPAQEKKREANDNLETGLLRDGKAVSQQGQATELLNNTEVTGLLEDEGATVPLVENGRKTKGKRTGGITLIMLEEIMLVHTEEVIE